MATLVLRRTMPRGRREINGELRSKRLILWANAVRLQKTAFTFRKRKERMEKGEIAFRRRQGSNMVAMNPVFLFFASLEGFDKAAFWIAAFTFVILTGFFLDYVMQRQGFGPYVNSILVIVGVWFGLYVRFNYLHPNQIHLNDPMLTIASVLGVTALMMVSLAFLRNRTS